MPPIKPGRLQPQRRRRSGKRNPELEWAAAETRLSERQLNQRRFNRRVRLVTAGLFLILGALIAVFFLRSSFKAGAVRDSGTVSSPPPIKALPPPDSPKEKTTAAIELIDAFFGIEDPTRRLALVFDAGDETADFLDYYGQRARTDPSGIHNRKVTAILEKDREILIVTFDDDQGRHWAAPVEWKVNAYRLHWGAMTGYGQIAWNRFIAERPAKPVQMRAKIYRPDSGASDLIPEGHEYVLIAHPELPRPFGALLGESETLKPLRELPANTDIPACVTMQWQDFGTAGQWPVVTNLVHSNWIR